VRHARFAGRYHNQRVNHRAARLAARQAWRHRWHARFVPWYGGIFWPFVYSDLFDYAFWPYGYAPGFWAFAYDDFYDGIFFPYGAYGSGTSDYAYAGPYSGTTTSSSSSRSRSSASRNAPEPGELSKSAQQLCSQPDSGVTAWPFDRIQKAVRPSDDQQVLLTNLKDAAGQAADRFKQACPTNVPMTPTGRLTAMTDRLQATLDSVKLVRPPLEKFYESLSDEQKARFNALGPSMGRNDRTASNDNTAGDSEQASCNGDRSGLTGFPIERIRDELKPNEEQGKQLDKLSKAVDESVKTLEAACPNYVARTPVGRLDTIEKRLQAMIKAANQIKPPLEDFYASLNDEQKAEFNQLGRDDTKTSERHSSVRRPSSVRSAERMIQRAIGQVLR
jgi:hypothetical protein